MSLRSCCLLQEGGDPVLVVCLFATLVAVEAARLEEPFSKLEEPFSKLEVFGALKGFSGKKTPGPDGFSMAFWQHS